VKAVQHQRLIAAGVAAWLGGSAAACVDTGPRPGTGPGGGGGGPPPTCEALPPVPYTGAATIPTAETTSMAGPYTWKNAVIKGGGFVSGVITSPVLPGLTFARTDVGGAYRHDPTNRRWMAITDWAGHNEGNLTGIESIAADPVDPNRVYIAAGTYLTAGNGSILISTDMGQTFPTRSSINAPMGGNVDGRSMGERLAVDPNLPSTLYFGSRNAGLFKSTDAGQSWASSPIQVGGVAITGATGAGVGGNPPGTGYGLTFVVFDPRSGAAGSATPAIYVGVGITTGTALYRSTDAGASWEAVAGQPPAGMMPHHAVPDGCGNLFLAYNNGSGPNGVTAGAIWRYATATGEWTEVSPPHGSYGFGGISADAAHPGTLVVTTIDNWSPGEIYRTTNGGTSWTPLVGAAQRDVAGAQYLWWHGSNLPAMGWMGDVEIDPFNPDRALFITGQGLWSTDDLTAADARRPTHWSFDNAGLEETVALDLASPPAGAPLLSGVGDIAGFKHDDLTISPTDGMFGNPVFGNTASLDYAELAPNIVARVGTNASAGGARGAYSTNGGTTWTPFARAPAATGTALPSAGTIAVSADGMTFVWSPQGGTTSYTRDHGASWTAVTGVTGRIRLAADRVNPSKFYASSGNRMYVSTDAGATFAAAGTAATGRPRTVFGMEGEVWVATNTSLLHSADSGASFTTVPQFNGASAVGFGMAAPGQTYPAVYVAGSVSGTWGTYRSDDAGVNWRRVDDPQHQFGFINILSGDPRQYGRVYLGTGGRGIVYGDPQ